MKILVACEESQEVTLALRKLGHEAYSCDIEECSGGFPEWHLCQDVRPLLSQYWDMVIAFPPCDHLASSGAAHFVKKRKDGRQQKAVEFFKLFTEANSPKIAVENPVGIMSTLYRKPDQIVQPYYFGDAYKKSTCLWLKGLPKLQPTKLVEPVFIEYNSKKNKSGKSRYSFMGKVSTRGGNLKHKKLRSKTPKGLAEAMALQWAGVTDLF
jgi:hypothetical protein